MSGPRCTVCFSTEAAWAWAIANGTVEQQEAQRRHYDEHRARHRLVVLPVVDDDRLDTPADREERL